MQMSVRDHRHAVPQLGVLITQDLAFHLAILICSELLYSGLRAADATDQRRHRGSSKLAAGWFGGNSLVGCTAVSNQIGLRRRSEEQNTHHALDVGRSGVLPPHRERSAMKPATSMQSRRSDPTDAPLRGPTFAECLFLLASAFYLVLDCLIRHPRQLDVDSGCCVQMRRAVVSGGLLL